MTGKKPSSDVPSLAYGAYGLTQPSAQNQPAGQGKPTSSTDPSNPAPTGSSSLDQLAPVAHTSFAAAQELLLDGLSMNRGPRPTVVRPGEGVGGVVASAVSDAITNVAANGVAVFRLTITPDQLDSLRVDKGSTSLRRDAVEALVLAQGASARTRIDAVSRWCAQLTRPLPQYDEKPLAVPETAPQPVVHSDLDSALARIVDEISNRTAPTISARADDASVRGRLHALDLAVGPADRVAFFDYGSLIGTVDGVWEELIDSDLVASTAALMDAAEGGPGGGMSMKSRVIVGPDGRIYVVPDREQTQDHRDGAPPPNAPPPSAPPTPLPMDARSPEYDRLLAEVTARLQEPYAFRVFAAKGDDRAVDFGVFVTYRQNWTPQGIQAGALVKTITLAPREERSYTSRTTYKKTTNSVRATNFETSRKTESQDTARAASDIVDSAKKSLGVASTISGAVDLGPLGSADSSTTITANQEKSSQRTRQNLRESVKKAAQESKESFRTEITVAESTETFNEESGKISNPNDELPVSYLFYQLQRRFRISEQVHEMVPVVMVARTVPQPNQITRGWLFVNAWMLRTVLLDEQFDEPLRYLMGDAAGAEAKVSELETRRERERVLLTEARHQPRILSGDAETDAQRDQSAREELASLSASYEGASQAYMEALSSFRTAEMGVSRLLVHVKQNILHYMRAIWNMEDRDQRIFELQSVRIPKLGGHLEYTLVPERDDGPERKSPPVPPLWIPAFKVEARLVTENAPQTDSTVPLGHVADLDHPLGYRGNFMVFPMRTHNVLTKFLSLPYIDIRMGASDPDFFANFTLADLDKYVACARTAQSEEDFAKLIPRVRELYEFLLERPFADEEEIVVPTDSTFIEALPGTRPVLEDYKLLHRVIDVAKAAAEVRARELENLRLVARIRAGQLSDPDIQTMVVAPEQAGINVTTPPSQP